ncbi:hypothetical protein RD055328_00360 [Companilactobacillus sp. RD055328]|uniref:helix-turn-helix domain-containing protein n=1 Tax=Companilactobacillus sp. RD055328 TaxID=2916634 RepID=UPI001FC827A8|nr:helix-turn-helix transcriptional regulator [Companilactobacillus sp. RD055328]GKQ42113.1 hypothetical protein RD055328_00360 [Companilactobacillus sp. RD055328]
MEDIAKKIRKQRIFLKLTISETAEKANLSESLISRFERGVITNISLEKFSALCNALDIDMGELFSSKSKLSITDVNTNKLITRLTDMPHSKREKISKNLLELWDNH